MLAIAILQMVGSLLILDVSVSPGHCDCISDLHPALYHCVLTADRIQYISFPVSPVMDRQLNQEFYGNPSCRISRCGGVSVFDMVRVWVCDACSQLSKQTVLLHERYEHSRPAGHVPVVPPVVFEHILWEGDGLSAYNAMHTFIPHLQADAACVRCKSAQPHASCQCDDSLHGPSYTLHLHAHLRYHALLCRSWL